jgi:hypothetical protein
VPSASRRNRCAAPRAPALERKDGHRAVDEDKKLVIFTVKASTFPNWDGAAQPRKIVALNADEFINEAVPWAAVPLCKTSTRARSNLSNISFGSIFGGGGASTSLLLCPDERTSRGAATEFVSCQ